MVVYDLNINNTYDFYLLLAELGVNEDFLNQFRYEGKTPCEYQIQFKSDVDNKIRTITFSVIESNIFKLSYGQIPYILINALDLTDNTEQLPVFLGGFCFLGYKKGMSLPESLIDKEEFKPFEIAIEQINGRYFPKVKQKHILKFFNYDNIENYPEDIIPFLWENSLSIIEAGIRGYRKIIEEDEKFYSLEEIIDEVEGKKRQ